MDMAMISKMVQKVLSLGASMSLLQLLAIGSVSGQALETPLDSQFSFSTWIEGRQYCLSANNARPDDIRDGGSVFVNMRQNCDGRITFTGEPVDTPARVGVILQATNVPTKLGPIGTNWYLSVHDFYENDSYLEKPDDPWPEHPVVRVILHNDRNKAAIWDVNRLVNGGSTSLDLIDNLDIHWDRQGNWPWLGHLPWLMAAGNVRSSQSFYVTVTPHFRSALGIVATVEELATTQG